MLARGALVLGLAVAVTSLASGCGDGASDGLGGFGSTDAGSGPGGPSSGPGGKPLGDPVDGEYNLGPVEWTGSFPNACAPYPDQIAGIDGNLLAGLSNTYASDGSLCDACIRVDTAGGKSLTARVVTYGETTAPGNIDVSQAAFDQLSTGEYPRTMTWQLVDCPSSGPLYYQFQTGANVYWTSLWVRNPRVAITKVEVKSANHGDFAAIERGPDGTFTDAGGFGDGAFTLRITGIDGSTTTQDFPKFDPGSLVEGSANL